MSDSVKNPFEDGAAAGSSSEAPAESTDTKKPAAKKAATKPAAKKPAAKKVDFADLSLDGPLSSISGQVSAVLSNNDTAVPVLKVSLVGWVGTESLILPAKEGFDDIRKVLDELEAQASKL